VRHLPGVLFTIALLPACSRPSADAESSTADASSPSPSEPQTAPIPAPAATTQAATSSAPAPAPASEPSAPTPEPSAPITFEVAVAPLISGHAPSGEAVARAWEHYEGQRFADAQREFALASLHERAAWKHPFNFACASARAADEGMVRVGLTEAVARDARKAASKARRDADLAKYRDAPWFEAALGGSSDAAARKREVAEPDVPLDPATLTSQPAPKDGQPLPSGVATPLAKGELARVRKALAASLNLEPTLRGSLALASPDGRALAFVVYDFTEQQLCKADAEGDRDDYASCLEDLEPQARDRSELGNRTKCVQQFLVRVELGVEPRLGEPIELEVACDPNDVRRFDAIDIDADGQLEVVLDTVGVTKTTDLDGETAYNRARQLAIARLDGTIQYQFGLAADAELPFTEIKRVFVHDVNADGHLDLLEQTIDRYDDLECAELRADLDFWPSCSPLGWQGHELLTTVMRYDAASDTWQSPS
jgi:hypothetical protein